MNRFTSRCALAMLVTGGILAPSIVAAQTVRISGMVADDRQTPLEGVTVRLSSEVSTRTSADGRFQFADVVPGNYVVTVMAIGHRLQSIPIAVARDTTLSVRLARVAVSLDTVVVRPRSLRVRITAVDSATGDYLTQAQARVFPGDRPASGASGVFLFEGIAPGPTTIVFEALEHLPRQVDFIASSDTTFIVGLAIDPVALKMTAAQVKRLESRSRSIAMPRTAINRDEIARERPTTVEELLIRRLYEDPSATRSGYNNSPEGGCFFLDDVKVSRGAFDAMSPDLIERVEIYRQGGGGGEVPSFRNRGKTERNFGAVQMVRVYTKRYVASLPRREHLPRASYSISGLRATCT